MSVFQVKNLQRRLDNLASEATKELDRTCGNQLWRNVGFDAFIVNLLFSVDGSCIFLKFDLMLLMDSMMPSAVLEPITTMVNGKR